MPLPVYLDYAATTPVDPDVAAAMAACLTRDGNFANPASRSHVFGWRAEEAVEAARREVADLIVADPREIVWTSGATEANNLALKGIVQASAKVNPRVITSAIEHKAVLDSCAWLEQQGVAVTYLQPGRHGLIDPAQVADAIDEQEAVLVSVMHVNNELGTCNDIAAIGEVCRDRGVRYHVDAAQSAGKVALDMSSMAVDLLSVSAHKMYGPKGIGFLYVRRDPTLTVAAQIHGGGHERGLRSGTLPVHQIVGVGKAAVVAAEHLVAEQERLLGLRDRLWSGIQVLPAVHLHGESERTVAGIVNVGFEGVDGESLLLALKDLALSTGSACTSASLEPSYVLRAIGVGDALAHSSLRISLGRFTTEAEVDFAVERIVEAVTRLRSVSPQWRQRSGN